MITLKIILGDDYPLGIPTITVLVLFIGGVQLAAVGVLGEYVGRIYDEVRRRPPYIVDRAINAVGARSAWAAFGNSGVTNAPDIGQAGTSAAANAACGNITTASRP